MAKIHVDYYKKKSFTTIYGSIYTISDFVGVIPSQSTTSSFGKRVLDLILLILYKPFLSNDFELVVEPSHYLERYSYRNFSS